MTLPGEDLVARGLDDLKLGTESVSALLVSIGAPRLRTLGVDIKTTFNDPEHRLYRLLSASHGDAAHSQYNALIRRLVSYERPGVPTLADAAAIDCFMHELGREATASAHAYFGRRDGRPPRVADLDDRHQHQARPRPRRALSRDSTLEGRAIAPKLYRYPALDTASFRAAVERVAAAR